MEQPELQDQLEDLICLTSIDRFLYPDMLDSSLCNPGIANSNFSQTQASCHACHRRKP